MELKTFEIFTSKYSKILQAENMAVAVFRFMELVEDANDAKDIIAIIDTEQGKEFLTSENSLHKHFVSNNEVAVCYSCDRPTIWKKKPAYCKYCGTMLIK